MPLRRPRHAAARREPRGAADEDRGQPRPPGEPRRDRRLRAGVGPRPLRPGPLAARITLRGNIEPWGAFLTQIKSAVEAKPRPGRRRACACSPAASPRRRSPRSSSSSWRSSRNLKWHQWEPAGPRPGVRRGAAGVRRVRRRALPARQGATSSSRSTPISWRAAPGSLRYAREFAERRRVTGGKREMNRLYVVEATPSPTGSIADHRLPLQAGRRRRLRPRPRGRARRDRRAPRRRTPSPFKAWLDPLVARPAGAPRREPGDRRRRAAGGGARARPRDQPGARQRRPDGRSSPSRSRRDPSTSSASLCGPRGRHGRRPASTRCSSSARNPVYTAPADLKFARPHEQGAAAHPPRPLPGRDRVALPLARSRGALPRIVERRPGGRRHGHDHPAAHRAALQRPHGARAGRGDDRSRRARRATTSSGRTGRAGPRSREGRLREVLAQGAARRHGRRHRRGGPKTVTARPGRRLGTPPPAKGLEIVFRADPSIFDGRFANNGWLQELPKPLTKLTWDNAALVSPATARAPGRQQASDVVELALPRPSRRRRRSGFCPARPPTRSRVHLGYGRTQRRHASATAPASTPTRSAPARRSGRRHGLEVAQDRRAIPAGDHAEPADDGRARRSCGRPRSRSSRRSPTSRTSSVGSAGPGHDAVPRVQVHGATRGGWRSTSAPASAATRASSPARPRTTSRSSARPRSSRGRKMHWLRVDRYYKGDPEQPDGVQPAGAVHAVRERAVRGGLPGGGDVPQQRGPERHGLQPLRRHAVLLEQLPLQGAPVQLLPLPGLEHAERSRCCATRTSRCAAAA